MIKCRFPCHEPEVKCRVVSRGEKSSTSSGNLLNFIEGGEQKRCSLKGPSWKSVDLDDQTIATVEAFYGNFFNESVYGRAKKDRIQTWKSTDTKTPNIFCDEKNLVRVVHSSNNLENKETCD